jgi:DNA-binding response OmpR family regulator
MDENPLILIIDDSHTIRKMVECHLSQAGYRVAMAADAEQGLTMARSFSPSLILLDHQLPGTTGEEVCRQLLDHEATAGIPVIISSAMRNRAYARYTDYANVVDQIPKPFTAELLKSGVANGLQMGEMVVKSQRTGCAMPEAVGEVGDSILEGTLGPFSLRALLDFLTNSQQAGRLTVESDNQRVRWALAGGRVQAVYSPTLSPDALETYIPPDLADLAPLLAITLGEQRDASMAGMIKLLEKSLADPRRLRALLRFQASALTYGAMMAEPGKFAFEPVTTLPPMFQAIPLQLCVPALIVDGLRHCDPQCNGQDWSDLICARQNPRGGNPDRTGLSAAAIKIHALLDGARTLGEVAQHSGLDLAEVVLTVRGLELASLVERRAPRSSKNILVLEEDPDAIRVIRQTLGPEGSNHQLKIVQDRVAAQLLLRRQSFQLVMLAMDRPDQEGFFRACKQQNSSGPRYIGILKIDDEGELSRLDAMGLDGVIQRPVNETDLVSTVNYLMPNAQH